ncbi:MAG: DNA cytosine methyltransferase [Anaerolineales bacterium]
MRVIDIFCGAGGFSEGFRQAGFEVIWGIDKWLPAVITHQKNHPSSNTVLDDVERIAFLSDEEFHRIVPDSEIIIGSPPCIAFSNSNKSGKGDKGKGIRLIEAYLRIVARKKNKVDSILKYWILENVPNVQSYIKEEYSAEDLELSGNFVLKVKFESSKLYSAQYFGVPSKRTRYICGNFPEPQKTIDSDEDLIHLAYVLNKLGIPKQKPDSSTIPDPNYNFIMPSSDVTDHHYIQELAEFEWEKAKQLKQDKGYMGKMSFPEDINRPARTVMATMSFSARESMIFSYGKDRYRAPTIREVACLMSFPIDYQFYGKSIGTKYHLIGNAVPPKLSYAFAKAIAQEENLDIPNSYILLNHAKNDTEFINLNWHWIPKRVEVARNPLARFKYHIPYLIINTYRVELTNHHSDFKVRDFRWDVEIHKSQGPRARKYIPQINETIFTNTEREIINQFKSSIENRLTSFGDFQKSYCLPENERSDANLIGPYELLEQVRDFLDDFAKFHDCSEDFLIDQEPFILPKIIVLGYFILSSIIGKMDNF